ncbi:MULTISPECIES: hypothetical protein [unclassified Mesorhizobium]|uniref:hypothetical protein n=1 Tax=unclassified Mesorhizobium TaxID=325217 RepID=UPI00333769ED
MKLQSPRHETTWKIVFSLTLAVSLTSCASLDQISTDRQRREIASTASVLVANRNSIRAQVDAQSAKGALVFTDNERKSIKLVLFGNSPLEAWVKHVAATHKGPLSSLPLPSSVSPTAAFIYSSKEIGKNELSLSADFDEEVAYYYQLAGTMARLGSDVQDIRDIVILLTISDKKQNESVLKVKESFGRLATNFDSLASDLQFLQKLQSDTRAEILGDLNDLARQMEDIRKILESM